jgi:hypothetical protein
LNANFATPMAFRGDRGTGFYAAPLVEYRPAGSLLGFMFQAGYDSRAGEFKQTTSPSCNCPADLSSDLSYISIEPSLRLSPFRNGFYIYLGPRSFLLRAQVLSFSPHYLSTTLFLSTPHFS